MAPRAIRTLITAIFVFVSTVLAAEGWAAGPPATRACSTTDLDGIYRLVDFREIPSRSFTHQMEMAPYDFLGFYSGSVWATLAFNMPPASLPSLERDLNNQKPGRNYVLETDGRLVLNHGKNVEFAGTCAVVKAAGESFQENDLILNGSQTGNPAEVHELFRRWNGEPPTGAVSEFDPAPSAAAGTPQQGTGLVDVQPTLPDDPAPVTWRVTTVGPNDGMQQIGVIVTNRSHTPLSAFMVVFRDAQTNGKWTDLFLDACLDHKAAWQPSQSWIHGFGLPIAVQKMEAYVGAAIFSDGSTWGNAHRLAKLKQHRGNCQWPGS